VIQKCRRNAARCAELAVATLQLRTTFLELSKNWEKLTIQLEDTFAKLTESEDIRSNVRESLNEPNGFLTLPLSLRLCRSERRQFRVSIRRTPAEGSFTESG
jgi:hypothetical protein